MNLLESKDKLQNIDSFIEAPARMFIPATMSSRGSQYFLSRVHTFFLFALTCVAVALVEIPKLAVGGKTRQTGAH